MISSVFLVALIAQSGSPVERADKVVRDLVDVARIPGVSYALIRDGNVVHTASFGYANLETKTKASRATVYEIGSMTKQFTAACVLLLADEGKVVLDDPVGKYLKDIPEVWKGLTIRRLLSHTAGTKDYLGSFDPGRTDYVTFDSIFEKVGKYPLDFQPGESWSYSNTGYLLASLLVERISGQKLADFMAKRIFTPLGMSHTCTSDPAVVVPNRAEGYGIGAKSYLNTLPINPSLSAGAGNLMSTVDDLAKWSGAIYSGKLLKKESLEAFMTPVNLNNGRSANYALGWFVHHDHGAPLIEHGGNTIGFSTEIFNIPAHRESIVILTNMGGFAPASMARRIAGILHPEYDLSNRKAVDPKPERSLGLIMTLRKFSRNNFDLTMFDPSMRAMLSTSRGIASRSGLAGFGKIIKQWAYIDGEKLDGLEVARYAFKIGTQRVYFEIKWTADDKIASFDQVYGE